jgi:hypothetical protein
MLCPSSNEKLSPSWPGSMSVGLSEQPKLIKRRQTDTRENALDLIRAPPRFKDGFINNIIHPY